MSCCRLTRSASRTITIGHLIIRCAVSISSARTVLPSLTPCLCACLALIYPSSVHGNSLIVPIITIGLFFDIRFMSIHRYSIYSHIVAFSCNVPRLSTNTRLSTIHPHTRISIIHQTLAFPPSTKHSPFRHPPLSAII